MIPACLQISQLEHYGTVGWYGYLTTGSTMATLDAARPKSVIIKERTAVAYVRAGMQFLTSLRK